MPHIAILMSSASQATEPTLQTTRMSETIVIKSQVLSLINEFLRQDFSLVGGEALRAVIHLVVIEVNRLFCIKKKVLTLLVVVGYNLQSLGSHERDQANDQASRRVSSFE